jgi:hypothetical protein
MQQNTGLCRSKALLQRGQQLKVTPPGSSSSSHHCSTVVQGRIMLLLSTASQVCT